MQADNIKFVPSYLFSAVDYETMQLSRELESLGGGDACTKQYEVHIVYTPFPWSKTLPPSSSSGGGGKNKYNNKGTVERGPCGDAQVIWASDKSLGLRDALQARHSSNQRSMKYYNVTSTTKLSDILLSPDERSFPVIREASKWLLDGFNACVLAVGERASGKTMALFGPSPPATVIARTAASIVSSAVPYSQDIPPSAALSILKNIYAEVQDEHEKPDGDALTVALSCWLVRGHHTIDLMRPLATTDASAVGFEAVECPSLSTAMQVISVARNRAPGVLAMEQPANDCERGHFFVRVLLHRRIRSTFSSYCGCTYTSHLHIVDLLGSCIVENDPFHKMFELNRIARRDHMLSLQALSKVLAQIKSLSRSGVQAGIAAPPPVAVTSARDSKLTAILAPLLQGNARVFALGFLRDGEQHHQQSSSTMQTLGGLCEVTSACHRVEGVALQSLRLRGYDYLLSPFLMTAVPFVIGSESKMGDDDGAATAAADLADTPCPSSGQQASHTAEKRAELPHVPQWERSLPLPLPEAISEEFDAVMKSWSRRGRHSRSPGGLTRSESDYFSAAANAPPPLPATAYSADALREGYGSVPLSGRAAESASDYFGAPAASSPSRAPYRFSRAAATTRSAESDSVLMLDTTFATDDAVTLRPQISPQRSPPPAPPSADADTFDEDSLGGSAAGAPSPPSSPTAADTSAASQMSPVSPSPEKKKKSVFRSLVHSVMGRRKRDLALEGAAPTPTSPTKTPSSPDFAAPAPATSSAGATAATSPARPPQSPVKLSTDTFSDLRVSFDETLETSLDPLGQLQDRCSLLLASLDAEHRKRLECEERARRAEEELRECSIQRELALGDANEAVAKLKVQIKNLCEGQNLGDVFGKFESDVCRLSSENELLRRRNLYLECKEIDAFSKAPHRDSIISTRGSTGYSADGGKSARLTSQIKKTKQENDNLKQQIEDLRASERHSLLSIKLAQDSNLRLRNTAMQLQRVREQLHIERNARLGKEKEVSYLQEEMKALLHTDTHYRGERERLISEVATLRARVRDFNFMQQQSLRSEWHGELAGSAGIVPATAGSFDGLHVRPEEGGVVGERVSSALARLHGGLVQHCPSLLPVFKDLAEAVYMDKDCSLSQNRELLATLYKRGSSSRGRGDRF